MSILSQITATNEALDWPTCLNYSDILNMSYSYILQTDFIFFTNLSPTPHLKLVISKQYIYILSLFIEKPYSKPLKPSLHSNKNTGLSDVNDIKINHGSL